MKKIYLLVLVFSSFWVFTGQVHAMPAFPGAEGFGANTVGGRSGQVIKVVNLNDSGVGSFRAAATVIGPRVVVFEVSGIINISSDISIKNPYVTIAGQTSPGGVAIIGASVIINTHDVIIRHMRFRAGTDHVIYDRDASGNIKFYNRPQYNWTPTYNTCAGSSSVPTIGYPCALGSGMNPDNIHGLLILGKNWDTNTAYNIILDHCSVSWGVDETLGVTGGVASTTIQWTIVSEGLSLAGHTKGEHSKGLMVSGKYRYDNFVTLHHNYIAHNVERNPLIYSPEDAFNNVTVVDVVNNVSYDWKGGLSMASEDIPRVNWVQNYAKRGVNAGSSMHDYVHELIHSANTSVIPRPILYVEGNIGTQIPSAWHVGLSYTSNHTLIDWKKDVPWNTPPVSTVPMSYAYAQEILTTVGATMPVRDSVDSRVIADFSAGTGAFKKNVTAADYPVFNTPIAPTDSDNDGMSDAWELSKGLNTNDASDRNNIVLASASQRYAGYTNLEYYLGELADGGIVTGSDLQAPSAPGGVSVN